MFTVEAHREGASRGDEKFDDADVSGGGGEEAADANIPEPKSWGQKVEEADGSTVRSGKPRIMEMGKAGAEEG